MDKESFINLFTAVFKKSGIGIEISFEPVQDLKAKRKGSEYILTINNKYDLFLTKDKVTGTISVYIFRPNTKRLSAYLTFTELKYDNMSNICANILDGILLTDWYSPGYPCDAEVMNDVLDK